MEMPELVCQREKENLDSKVSIACHDEPYHRSAKSSTYEKDIESFLLPSKPAKVLQGEGIHWG